MNLKQLLPAALLLVSASAFAQGGAAFEPSQGVSEDAASQRAQAQEFRRQGDHLKEAEAYEKVGDLEAAAKSLFVEIQEIQGQTTNLLTGPVCCV